MPSVSSRVDLGEMLDLYEKSEETRDAVSHNIGVLKCIRGGLRQAERHRITFDPRGEYWRLPERRFAVAYFAERWSGRFAPASALRAVAQRVISHFDQARTDGIVVYRGIDYKEAVGLDKICSALADHARRLPPIPEWEQLRSVWPRLATTAGEDVADFLLALPETEGWERGFAQRLPWFGYLGARSNEDLRSRQAFFFGYANLWTTTNAYRTGGAQNFAPVIQNTPTDRMLDTALRWATGTNPVATTFQTLGRDDDDDEPQDRSLYAPVVEMYGFLNLERAPFYNNLAETYRDWFGIERDINPYEMTAAVGRITAEWLVKNPEAVKHLLNLFRRVIDQRSSTRVGLETIEAPRIRKQFSDGRDPLLDIQLFEELETNARSGLMKLGDRDAAALTLHLLLDSKLYLESREPIEAIQDIPTKTKSKPPAKSTVAPPSKQLPVALRPYGERALTYLKAGFHVLFAGAPGTGKTTLAQFVGYAWDRELGVLPASNVRTLPAHGERALHP